MKRKHLVALLCLLLLAITGPARAQDENVSKTSNPPDVQTTVIVPAGEVVTATLQAFAARDAKAVFASLSEQQRRAHGDDPARYLKAVRLKQHELYDHFTHRVLSSEQNGMDAIHKIELKARDGRTSLAIFRLRQQMDGTWRIDHVGVVSSSDERDA